MYGFWNDRRSPIVTSENASTNRAAIISIPTTGKVHHICMKFHHKRRGQEGKIISKVPNIYLIYLSFQMQELQKIDCFAWHSSPSEFDILLQSQNQFRIDTFHKSLQRKITSHLTESFKDILFIISHMPSPVLRSYCHQFLLLLK